MSPPSRNPRAIPGLVTDDTTPPPHDLGAGAHLAWQHAESIGARVAMALGEQLQELAGQVEQLRAAPPVPAAPAPARPLAPFLQTAGIVMSLLAVAFVLYRQLAELAVKVETIGKAQERAVDDTQRQLDRFEDRLYNLPGRGGAAAPTPPAAIGP